MNEEQGDKVLDFEQTLYDYFKEDVKNANLEGDDTFRLLSTWSVPQYLQFAIGFLEGSMSALPEGNFARLCSGNITYSRVNLEYAIEYLKV